jgi:hypothetical protein
MSETDDLIIYNIRTAVTSNFSVVLLTTPFDNFSIPFKIELVSGAEAKRKFRFTLHTNQGNLQDNITIRNDADNLPEFNIDFA